LRISLRGPKVCLKNPKSHAQLLESTLGGVIPKGGVSSWGKLRLWERRNNSRGEVSSLNRQPPVLQHRPPLSSPIWLQLPTYSFNPLMGGWVEIHRGTSPAAATPPGGGTPLQGGGGWCGHGGRRGGLYCRCPTSPLDKQRIKNQATHNVHSHVHSHAPVREVPVQAPCGLRPPSSGMRGWQGCCSPIPQTPSKQRQQQQSISLKTVQVQRLLTPATPTRT